MQYTQQEQAIISQAIAIIEAKTINGESIANPQQTKELLRLRMAPLGHEVFTIVFLSTQHTVIAIEEMFRGTIDAASVYPREVAKRCLELGASAVILAHNHPSGSTQESQADIQITRRLQSALELLDIRVLDHIIVSTSGAGSFAERGLL